MKNKKQQYTTIYYTYLSIANQILQRIWKKKKMFKNKQNNKYLNLTKKSETFWGLHYKAR
jgi:hypothetical protein